MAISPGLALYRVTLDVAVSEEINMGTSQSIDIHIKWRDVTTQ